MSESNEILIVRFLHYKEKERNYCDNVQKRHARVFQHLNELYGKFPVSQCTPMMLKTIRCELLERKLCVVLIDQIINIKRQLFY